MSVNRFFIMRMIFTRIIGSSRICLAAFLWALRRKVRINRIFATGLRAAPHFDVGLRRRNNELNELTNCCAAWLRGLPLKGAHIQG